MIREPCTALDLKDWKSWVVLCVFASIAAGIGFTAWQQNRRGKQ